MVNHLGAVCIGIKRAMLTAVPDLPTGFISHIALIIIECFRNKMLRFQIKLL